MSDADEFTPQTDFVRTLRGNFTTITWKTGGTMSSLIFQFFARSLTKNAWNISDVSWGPPRPASSTKLVPFFCCQVASRRVPAFRPLNMITRPPLKPPGLTWHTSFQHVTLLADCSRSESPATSLASPKNSWAEQLATRWTSHLQPIHVIGSRESWILRWKTAVFSAYISVTNHWSIGPLDSIGILQLWLIIMVCTRK